MPGSDQGCLSVLAAGNQVTCAYRILRMNRCAPVHSSLCCAYSSAQRTHSCSAWHATSAALSEQCMNPCLVIYFAEHPCSLLAFGACMSNMQHTMCVESAHERLDLVRGFARHVLFDCLDDSQLRQRQPTHQSADSASTKELRHTHAQAQKSNSDNTAAPR